MRNKRDNDQLDLDLDVGPLGPVRFRREVRGGSSRSRVSKRRKGSSLRRKTAKPGGIHQRSNKRTNW